MDVKVGDSLSSYPNLDFLHGNDAEDLLNKLRQINLPYKIVAMYAQGSRHYAWISLTKAIKKVKEK